ncbi:MAG: DUF120 domain-containing protein [Planctomycetota bacterium]|jgi:CTP-dependent riboflavin kinase
MCARRISGRLATGRGLGKHYTQLDWARRQFVDKLGIDPFPGTVNLIVNDPASMTVWDGLKEEPGVRIKNPNPGPHDCCARCFRVSVEGSMDAAIVLPEVAGYPSNQVEIIAAIGIRDAMDVSDGVGLTVEVT